MSNTERVLYFPEGKIMKTIICDDEKSTCSELEEIILKYAKEKSVDLIVVGYKSYSAIEQLLVGSTASKVARYAPCSVLIYRPKKG